MKYKKDFLLICEHFTKEENNKYGFIGIFDYIHTDSLPTTWPKLILAGKAWVTDETVSQVEVHVTIKDPDGQIFLDLPKLEIKNIPTGKDEFKTITFTYNLLGLTFVKEGIYKFEVECDDEDIGSTRLRIKQNTKAN